MTSKGYDDSRWMDAHESGAALRCHPKTVPDLARRHSWHTDLVTARGGKKTVYDRADVARYAALHGIALPEVDNSQLKATISNALASDAISAPAPLAKILTLPRRETPVLAETGAYLRATAAGRAVADARVAVLSAWDAWRAAERGDDAAFAAWWSEQHPDEPASRATLFAWRRDLCDGGIDALVPLTALRKARGHRIPRELLGRFIAYYGTENRISIARAWMLTKADALRLELECPSYGTFQNYVAKVMPEGVKTRRRRGQVAFHNEHDPVMRRSYANVAGNEWWDSDHHQFDLFCCDEHGKAVRPWLTVWQDIRTEAYMGWCISTSPNSTTIFLAFKKGIERYGIPTKTLTDNGKDYKIHDFSGMAPRFTVSKLPVEVSYARSVLGRLHVEPHFAIPYAPRGKPAERSFVEVKESFSKFWPDAYCGGAPGERPEDYNQWLRHPERLPSFLEVVKQFGLWCEEYYNRLPISKTRAAGMERLPRIEAWKALTPVVRRVIDTGNLALLCQRSTRPITVMRGGIHWRERVYDAPELDGFDRQRVLLRFDPENLDEIFVFDEADRFIARAEAIEAAEWGGGEQQYREHAARTKRKRRVVTDYLENVTAGIDAERPTVTALIAASSALEAAEKVSAASEQQAQITAPFEMEESWREARAAAVGAPRARGRADEDGDGDDALAALDGKYLKLFRERSGSGTN